MQSNWSDTINSALWLTLSQAHALSGSFSLWLTLSLAHALSGSRSLCLCPSIALALALSLLLSLLLSLSLCRKSICIAWLPLSTCTWLILLFFFSAYKLCCHVSCLALPSDAFCNPIPRTFRDALSNMSLSYLKSKGLILVMIIAFIGSFLLPQVDCVFFVP